MNVTDDYRRVQQDLDRLKKPKAKDIFDGINSSRNSKTKMQLKDKYSRKEVEDMNVADIKKLIRAHNLHTTYIKGYSTLRKAALISAFLKHYKVAQQELKRSVSPQKSLDEVVERALTVKRGRPRKNTYAAPKPKPTELERKLGVADKAFPKGIRKTAKEDLERAEVRRSARLRKKQSS